MVVIINGKDIAYDVDDDADDNCVVIDDVVDNDNVQNDVEDEECAIDNGEGIMMMMMMMMLMLIIEESMTI